MSSSVSRTLCLLVALLACVLVVLLPSASAQYGCYPCAVTACSFFFNGATPNVSFGVNSPAIAAAECATLNTDIGLFIATAQNASCQLSVAQLACEVILAVNETELNCTTASIGIGTPFGNQTYFEERCGAALPCLGYTFEDEVIAASACTSFQVFLAAVIAQPVPSALPCAPCTIPDCYGLAPGFDPNVTFWAGTLPGLSGFACPVQQATATALLANANPQVPVSLVQQAVCSPLAALAAYDSPVACNAGQVDTIFDGIIFASATAQNLTWQTDCYATIPALFQPTLASRLIAAGYCTSPSAGLTNYALQYLINSSTSVTSSTGSSGTGAPATAPLCFLFYSLPGNIDYPWSSAISMTVQYSSQPVSSSQGTYVTVTGGSGTRVFTNKFGVRTVSPFTVTAAGVDFANNRLYLNSPFPVDGFGLTLNLSSPIQQPGHGPTVLYSLVNLYNASGVVVESHSSRIDNVGSAFLSTVPGFLNTTIAPSNINSLSASYATCQAPLTFTNGLRVPTQPSGANGGTTIRYSYSISDGVSYRVQGNLTLTASSAFATNTDLLGNPYQSITAVTGTRLYTYLPTGATVTSIVSGVTTGAYPNADQRFYPYALLASAPGVYSPNTAPFFDFDGLEFGISPSAPANGNAPGSGTQYNATSVYFTTPVTTAVLTEGYYTALPVVTYQTQSYSFA